MSGRIDITHAGGVATVMLANMGKRNALDRPMLDRLGDALDEIAADGAVHAVLLRGEGEQAFSAGLDFAALASGEIEHNLAAFEAALERVTDRLRAMPQPVVAALRGGCLGAGVQIAVACDLRLAGDDLKFGVPAAAMGMIYPPSAIARMVELAGPGGALLVLGEAEPLGAAAALALGYVERVVAATETLVAADALAHRLAAHPAATTTALKRIVALLAGGAGVEACHAPRRAAHAAVDLDGRVRAAASRRR